MEGMKNTYKLLTAVCLIMGSMMFSSCLNEDNKIPPNCYDGILNNDEELVDCGGPNCPLCDPCENGIYEPELGEQWVDCGGDCDPCDPSYNGQLDPGETGIDCGGDTGVDCGELCGDGLLNGLEEDVDCGGPDCDPCPTCTDGEMNGDEIGIDCGGPDCDPCATNGDCTNGLLDGDELYIDCGGSTCPPCEGTFTWKANGQQIVADFETQAIFDAGTITIGGVSLSTATMQFSIPEPDPIGWEDGVVVQFNSATAPLGVGNYVSATSDVFSTQNATANISMTITYVVAESGGFIVGEFSGNMFQDDGTSSVNISNGNFALPID